MFTKLKNDDHCRVMQTHDSTFAGKYIFGTPLRNKPCYQMNPQMIIQHNVGYQQSSAIDVESELQGRNDISSGCGPIRRHIQPRNVNPFLGGKECNFPIENTRMEEPACNLRGIPNNIRWDYPHTDPQAHIFFGGKANVDTRREFKDNHRPCLQFPLNY